MKNIEAHALTIALAGLHDRSMPSKAAHAIVINHQRLLPHAEAYESDRSDIITACSELNSAGEPVVVDGNYQILDMDDLDQRIQALNDRPVTVALKTISADDLGELTPNEIRVLMPMLVTL